MPLDPAIADKREEILRLAKKNGAYNVRVFGSFARGEARPDSDLDLLVDMEDGRSLLDLIGFWLDVKEIMNRDVDVISEGGISRYMRENILGEAIPL